MLYPATETNILILESYLKEQCATSALNCRPPLPATKTHPAHIHLKKNSLCLSCTNTDTSSLESPNKIRYWCRYSKRHHQWGTNWYTHDLIQQNDCSQKGWYNIPHCWTTTFKFTMLAGNASLPLPISNCQLDTCGHIQDCTRCCWWISCHPTWKWQLITDCFYYWMGQVHV